MIKINGKFLLEPKGICGAVLVLVDSEEFTRRQEELFSTTLDLLAAAKITPRWVHLGNSAGCLRAHDSRLNAVRGGIASYGFDQTGGKLPQLRPALRVISTVILIRLYNFKLLT